MGLGGRPQATHHRWNGASGNVCKLKAAALATRRYLSEAGFDRDLRAGGLGGLTGKST
jgi:hypothetical protein